MYIELQNNGGVSGLIKIFIPEEDWQHETHLGDGSYYTVKVNKQETTKEKGNCAKSKYTGYR